MPEQKNGNEEKKSDSSVHEIPIMTKKPMDIYRMLPTQHGVSTNNKTWILIPGLQKAVRVTDDSVDVIITAHGHGAVQDGSARLDLGIFLNGECIGIDGNKQAPGWGQQGGNGTGLSHTASWCPIVSFASVTLPKSDNDYVIDCRMKGVNNKNSSIHGTAFMIQVFKTQQLIKWFDIDLDDDKTYFNTNLEYRIQIKSKSYSYAMTVQKEKLWFFYADDRNSENSGIKCITFKDKRCFEDKYYVTKIQCSVRSK